MSPFLAAPPPADLPTVAYVPTVQHSAQLLTARSSNTHTVRPGDTVYDIAARQGVTVEAIVRANGLSDGGRWILPGARLVIPGGGGTGAPAPAQSTSGTSHAKASGGRVTVRSGDTLWGIATRHSTTVSALASANGIRATRLIYPGQVLVVPGSRATSATQASTSASSTSGTTSVAGSPGTSSTRTVTVRAGDTLWGIAARHGVSVAAIARASGISAADFIFPGQKLSLPAPATLSRPYDETTIGDHKKGEKVLDSFLHYRYSDGVARSAAANREYLASIDVPAPDEMKAIIVTTSRRYGVDHKLMLALAYQESGWNMRAVSAANAIGALQVIPSSGQWASTLVGRDLNLLDPHDNAEAGVAIMAALQRATDKDDHAIGGYYQGLASVREHGLFKDTEQYVRNIKHLASTL